MNVILVDGIEHQQLLPLTFTRPVSAIRIGILTIREKWEKRLNTKCSCLTAEYLSEKYKAEFDEVNYFINSSVCPDEGLIDSLLSLKTGQSLKAGEIIIAQKIEGTAHGFLNDLEEIEYSGSFIHIDKPWKIFSKNAEELEKDFDFLTKGRISAPLSNSNTLIGDKIFAEEGVKAEAAILNSTSGPIYLGAHSEVMEGSIVRGALALCEHSGLKLGAKIYGATTVGPHSKVGGEVNNSVITGFSNKGHDGFLGNAVLGEWCNLGADTNNSNLKNNYEEVKLWSYKKGGFEKTGLQFCGLIMGDHSKCGINTMFNTGTVVGVSANIFGSGFPRNFIPSFSWGGAAGFTTYKLEKALQTARLVMQRRGIELTESDEKILTYLFDDTAAYRQK